MQQALGGHFDDRLRDDVVDAAELILDGVRRQFRVVVNDQTRLSLSDVSRERRRLVLALTIGA